MRFLPVIPVIILLKCTIYAGNYESSIDSLGDHLKVSSKSGEIRFQMSGTLELETYKFDGPPPGLIRSDDEWLWNPRAVVFLDLQAGPRVYGFAQVRLDRGFDPADEDAELRLDEFALRITPWEDGRFNLQVGQSATIVGQWVRRHLAWKNPFVTAPLIYENPTRLTDLYSPYSPYSLVYPFRRSGYYYNPIIWGPSYSSGMTASGRMNTFEWALELKNAALMSRPELWPLWNKGFDRPTYSGRLAWRPDLRWTFGISASEGNWAGSDNSFYDKDAYRQRLLLFDISYAYRHLLIWSEYAYSEFAFPGVDQPAWTSSWFIEARYKLTPRLSLAARWNEQWFSELLHDGHSIGRWGNDVERLDFALTWRFNAHVQIQAELNRYWGKEDRTDGIMLASRLTMRF